MHSLWYFFLKIFKRNPTLKKGDLNPSSLINRLWISTFSLNQSNDILSFRQKNYPTLHSFHSKNNFVSYKLSLKVLRKFFNIYNNNLFLKKFFFSENVFFSIILFLFFLKNNYFKFFNLFFFKKINTQNLIKIITLFLLSLSRINNKLVFFNLNNYNDWFKYNFDQNSFIFLKKSLRPVKIIKLYENKNIIFFKKKFQHYASKLNVNYNSFLHVWAFYFNKASMSLVFVNNVFKTLNQHYYPVRFNESSSNKFIELNKISDYCFFFLRKNRIFNKGRYSRNRQTYRTGVYWCLWVNILSLYGLYFLFYRFTFNFGFLWTPLMIFFGSFIFSRALKYNFFNLNFVIFELKSFYRWTSFLYQNFYNNLIKIIDMIVLKFSSVYIFSFFRNFEELFLFKYLYSNSFSNYFFLIKNNENKFENVWDSLNNSVNRFFLKS